MQSTSSVRVSVRVSVFSSCRMHFAESDDYSVLRAFTE